MIMTTTKLKQERALHLHIARNMTDEAGERAALDEIGLLCIRIGADVPLSILV
jgi:hypothetical protein